MAMKADDIEKIVEEILTLKNVLPKQALDERYTEFRTKNRVFYETILNGEFDYSIFKEMMKAKRKLEAGQDQLSVDTAFGQFMADRYITPALQKAETKEETNKKRKTC